MSIEKENASELIQKFFGYIEQIRTVQNYKEGTLTGLSIGGSNGALLDLMNVSEEQQQLKSAINEKQKILGREQIGTKGIELSDFLNKKVWEILGLNIGVQNIIEYPNIKTSHQFSINLLKLRGLLKSYEGDISEKLESFVDIFLNFLKTNNISEDIEIVKKNGNIMFINFSLSEEFLIKGLEYVDDLIHGNVAIGNISNKSIIIDYSSPNVAKQMTVGHLRSTLIGEVFKNVFERKGKAVVLGFNHLGDWGEQFGKIFFTLLYSSDEEIQEFRNTFELNPNKALFDIYVRYKKIEGLFDDSRDRVKKLNSMLTNGDKNLIGIWKIIREISIGDFKKVYDRLGITFESRLGEAFYEALIDDVIIDLENQGFLVEDEDGQKIYILKREDEKMILLKKDDPILELLSKVELANPEPNGDSEGKMDTGKSKDVIVFQKVLKNSSGVTNYLTRDLAALKFRREYIGIDYVLYLTGVEQNSHFQVLNIIGNSLGYLGENNFDHIGFGLYLQKGKKMSSREGNVLKLTDVFNQVDGQLQDERLSNAAILVNDLKQLIHKGVEFDPEKITKPEGDTGVYLLYTAVRCQSILNRNNYNFSLQDIKLDFIDESYRSFAGELFKYKIILEDLISQKKLNILISYGFDIAHKLSNLYSNGENILNIESPEKRNSMLSLIYLGVELLKDIFSFMNISLPQEIIRR